MNVHERIPQDLLYRIYGNSLAVIMSVKENRVILLQDEPLKVWKQVVREHKIDQRDYLTLQQFFELGLLENRGAFENPNITGRKNKIQ